jgi:hypothetical protein
MVMGQSFIVIIVIIFMNHWHFYYIWLSLLSIVYSSHPKDRNGDMIGI